MAKHEGVRMAVERFVRWCWLEHHCTHIARQQTDMWSWCCGKNWIIHICIVFDPQPQPIQREIKHFSVFHMGRAWGIAAPQWIFVAFSNLTVLFPLFSKWDGYSNCTCPCVSPCVQLNHTALVLVSAFYFSIYANAPSQAPSSNRNLARNGFSYIFCTAFEQISFLEVHENNCDRYTLISTTMHA